MKLIICRNRQKDLLKSVLGFFFPLLIIGCSGSIGKIDVEHVDAITARSEIAIDQARLANAGSLSKDLFQKAETALKLADQAKEAKQGLDAIRLAYDAQNYAQSAEKAATYKSQEASLNAIIQRKETEILRQQSMFDTINQELEDARLEIQKAEADKVQLKREFDHSSEIAAQNLTRARDDCKKDRIELSILQEQFDETKTEWQQALHQIDEYETQIYKFRRQLAMAESVTDEAKKTANQARTKAALQGQSYSQKIDNLKQEKMVQDHTAMLEEKARQARQYVQRQKAWNNSKTGKSSLDSQKQSAGKSAITDWYLAWIDKNMTRHLQSYTADTVAEKILIRSNGEKRDFINRGNLATEIKNMTLKNWTLSDSAFQAERDSMIGTYRFNKVSNRSSQPVTYDVWEREVWMRENDKSQWEVHREIWRIYEEVPRY